MFGLAHGAFGHARMVKPYSGGDIACNSGSLDWAVAIGCDPNVSTFLPTALELARCVRPGGKLLVNLLPGTAPNTEDLRWTFDLAQSRQIGNKIRIVWPAEVGGFGEEAVVPPGSALILDLAESLAASEARPVATGAATVATDAPDISVAPVPDVPTVETEIPVVVPDVQPVATAIPPPLPSPGAVAKPAKGAKPFQQPLRKPPDTGGA
jgi:hypothetical protein